MPQEYSQDLTKELLDSILRPIQEQGSISRQRATSSAIQRGVASDPTGFSLEGLADVETNKLQSDAVSQFQYNLANLGREDRLRSEGREWQLEDVASSQEFTSSEAEKSRKFQQMLANQATDTAEKTSTNELWGAGIGALGTAGGMALGGPLGGALGKGLASYFTKKALPAG